MLIIFAILYLRKNNLVSININIDNVTIQEQRVTFKG